MRFQMSSANGMPVQTTTRGLLNELEGLAVWWNEVRDADSLPMNELRVRLEQFHDQLTRYFRDEEQSSGHQCEGELTTSSVSRAILLSDLGSLISRFSSPNETDGWLQVQEELAQFSERLALHADRERLKLSSVNWSE